MTIRPPANLLLLLLAGLAFTMGGPYAAARVFLSGGDSPLAAASEEAGFKQVYKTEYKINGADAALEVYAADLPAAVAAQRLQDALRGRQINATVTATEAGGSGVLATKDELTRMLLQAAKPGRTMLYAVRQSTEDAAKYAAARAGGEVIDAKLPGIPAYPGARLVHHVEDKKTKTLLAVYKGSGEPSLVRDYFAQSLPPNGWQPVFPGGPMYRRGPMNCMISVTPSQQLGELTITVLVRHSSL
ncbi:MAG: hypothetical protein HZA91_05540 [Verrucomicrobia bacterium]|nr:hypothetical protein [Verrucomicrobiota bacterium]